MKKIFINGMNSKTGGGKSILNNLLKLLPDMYDYYVLTPNLKEYQKFKKDYIHIIDIKTIYKKSFLLPFTYKKVLPSLIDRLNIDVVFNLATLPIVTCKKQIYLYDWSYAVYPESKVWQMMDIKSYLNRKIKVFYFKKYIKYTDIVIAQTKVTKKRLKEIYNVQNIEVIPNAISLENLDGGEYKDFNLPDGIKLLYLTVYYPHKNLEIFIPLAKKIKEKKLDFKIITTISPKQHKKAEEFLENIKKEKLGNIIINIGPVEMKNVPSLYKQCDGLLMPTLLESYGLTYFEAMYHKLPIFTSNIDFAKEACKNVAFYFIPFDANDILNILIETYNNKNLLKEKVEEGKKLVESMDKWQDTIVKYCNFFEKIIDNEN